MIKEKVLPADTFVVVNRTILNNEDRKLLIMLYQPIIGYKAISLYFTLWSDLDKREITSIEYTHHHLMTSMQLRLTEIIEAREKLEAIGLIKTYIKKQNINNFVYELYSPISASEFLNNPILSTSLFNNVGKFEYEKIIDYFKVPRINLKEYQEITCNFDEVFAQSNINEFEIVNSNLQKFSSNKLNITPKIDIDNIVSMIPDDMLNIRSLTKDTKDLIYKISFIYNYDDATMSELIRNSLNDKKMIDKKALRLASRKLYQFDNSRVKRYCGNYLYEFDNSRIKEYCGRYLLEFDGRYIKEYCGRYLYEVVDNKIKRYCGEYLYEIEGFISRSELMALIAVMFA